jgi:hypothetical protein
VNRLHKPSRRIAIAPLLGLASTALVQRAASQISDVAKSYAEVRARVMRTPRVDHEVVLAVDLAVNTIRELSELSEVQAKFARLPKTNPPSNAAVAPETEYKLCVQVARPHPRWRSATLPSAVARGRFRDFDGLHRRAANGWG